MRYGKLAILLLVTIFLFSNIDLVFAQTNRTFQLYLTINNTSNKVYIPVNGVGEVDSSSLGAGTNYTSKTNDYIASYNTATNELVALVANVKANRLFVKNSTNTHTIMLEQNFTEEKVFLVFSTGNYRSIDARIRSIADGTFLSNIKPTFGFGLGLMYPVKLLLNYTNIDIAGNEILQRGRHGLILNYTNVTGNKPVIEIKRI